MAKGASKQAQNLFGYEKGAGQNFLQKGGQDRNEIFPFLSNELTNPQGFGTTALDQMLTQGGEAVSGATGAAGEAAALNASRTGNTAAVPGIIDANARNAMKQQSDNALNVNIQNAKLKSQQQQDAASGLGSLYGDDEKAALGALGLGNDTLGEWGKLDQTNPNAVFSDAYLTSLGKNLSQGLSSSAMSGGE